MTKDLPTVASFWFGSDLTWLELLCIRSYLDCGHRFVLYTAHPVSGVPDKVDLRPASEVLWPAPFDLANNDRRRVAVFSDLFRLRMCQKTDFIWVDLDAYCVRPFRFETAHVFGRTPSGQYPNGILRLPAESRALNLLLEFVTRPNPIQPWRGPKLRNSRLRRIEQGQSWGIESLPWGCSGPKALGHFLQQTGEDIHAQPACTFYPLEPEDLWRLHHPRIHPQDIERDGVYSVHIYGHQKKWLANAHSGLPVSGSYLEHLCKRHGIDPAAYPITPLEWMAPKRGPSDNA